MKYPDDFINKIICGDCLEVMKEIPDKSVDLVVTDPPYGIGASSIRFKNSTSPQRNGYYDEWDKRIDEIYFKEMFRISRNQIIFGMNYYIEFLKNTSCLIIWDKKTGENSYADAEIAWTSFGGTIRIIRKLWLGANAKELGENRYHPTQKPVGVMCWILENYSIETDFILDPFLGSGTTAIACKELDRRFIGIEISPEYCKIAEQRLKNTMGRLL